MRHAVLTPCSIPYFAKATKGKLITHGDPGEELTELGISSCRKRSNRRFVSGGAGVWTRKPREDFILLNNSKYQTLAQQKLR
jgi:hypothetical protein